jgi:hypothetical protein
MGLADEAEEAAARFMVRLGYVDARRTAASGDGGIDVDSSAAVAQVKAHMKPVGRPMLQQLHGAATALGKAALFFALDGYTAQAVGWADGVGMALFRFDHSGAMEAVNDRARSLLYGRSDLALWPWEVGFGCRVSDGQVHAAADGACLRREQLVTLHCTWVPLIPVDVSITGRQRGRPVEQAYRIYVDALAGRRCGTPNVPVIDLGPVPNVMPSNVAPDHVVRDMNKAVAAYRRVRQKEAKGRHGVRLEELGLPVTDKTIRTASSDTVVLPVAVARYQTRTGCRCQVWELVHGQVSRDLTSVFTVEIQRLGPCFDQHGRRLV